MMKSSIKVTYLITEVSQPLQKIFNELKRQKRQLPLTMFFHKVEKKKGHYWRLLAINIICAWRHRCHLLCLLHLPKMMILMTLLPFRQKVNIQAQRHNAYTINPLHLLIVGIMLSSYHRRRRRHHHHHHHHHQWSSQQQEEWRSRFDGKRNTIFISIEDVPLCCWWQ